MDVDSALMSVKSLLSKKGHDRLYPYILKDLLLYAEYKKEEGYILTLARADEKDLYLNDIQKYIADENALQVDVDETIIGGYVLSSKDKVVDGSYKRYLRNLYSQLIR